MNIRTGREIGYGYYGTVYEAEIDGEKVIMKMEKYDGDLSTKSTYIRQLIFNEFAKRHKEYFNVLVFSGIREDCGFKKPIPKEVIKNAYIIKDFAYKNKLTQCSVLIYKPLLDGTLYDLKISDKKFTKLQYYDGMQQLVLICSILKKNGWRHRDIHAGNIMYKRKGDEYEWYLIDYGMICHKLFERNMNDDSLDQNPQDIIGVLWAFMDNPIIDYMAKNKIAFPSFNNSINIIKNDERYKAIIKYLPMTNDEILLYDSILLVACVLFYDLYMKAIGMDPVKYKKYMTEQEYPKTILYIVKNCQGSGPKILRYLEKNKM